MRQGQSKSLVFGNGVFRTRLLPIPQNWHLAGIKSGLTFADHCFTGSGRIVMNAFLPVRRMLSSPEGQAILASMSSPDGFPMTATGWTWAGGSSGRGCNAKNDRTSVWLRPLCRDWRDEPGVSEPGPCATAPPDTRACAGPGACRERPGAKRVWRGPVWKGSCRAAGQIRGDAVHGTVKDVSSAARGGDAVQGHCRMIERPETGPFSRPIASAACTAFAARRPPCRSRTART